MSLDEVLHDRQAEPRPADLARSRLVHSVEALGDPRWIGRRDPDARVADADLDAPVRSRPGLDADLPALGRELDRVVHEVHQDLDETVPVRVDGEAGWHRALEGLAALRRLALEHRG